VPSGAIWGSGGISVTRIFATCSRNFAPVLCWARTYPLSWGIALSSPEQRHQALFGLGALFAFNGPVSTPSGTDTGAKSHSPASGFLAPKLPGVKPPRWSSRPQMCDDLGPFPFQIPTRSIAKDAPTEAHASGFRGLAINAAKALAAHAGALG